MIINKARGHLKRKCSIDLREEYFPRGKCGLLNGWFSKRLTYTGTYRENKCSYTVLDFHKKNR